MNKAGPIIAAIVLVVAITLMMLAPIAVLIGTPRNTVSSGISMMPPPTPSIAPKAPTRSPISRVTCIGAEPRFLRIHFHRDVQPFSNALRHDTEILIQL